MPTPKRMVEHDGRTLTLEQWAAETGIPVGTIRSRLDRLGWDAARALAARPDRRFTRGGRPKADQPRAVPKIRKDTTGKAYARWRQYGRDSYRTFGPWGSAEARDSYRRFAAEWVAGAYSRADAAAGDTTSVGGIVLRWIAHTDAEYRKLGRKTSEAAVCRAAAVRLVELYGPTPAAEFAPAQLRAVRAAWVAEGKSLNTVNGYTARIVRMFSWSAGQSLVPAAVHGSLARVERLKPGRGGAPVRGKTQPVSADAVAAALAALPDNDRSPVIRAMVTVQRLTGMRPQHICGMRESDLDRSGEVWVYTPPHASNKTLHRGKSVRFFLGRKSQEAIRALLERCPPAGHVFGYSRGGRWVAPNRNNYCLSIRRACDKAGIPRWHPHQLRHALATEVAERFRSLDHAAAAIGDHAATAEAVYVHVDPQERARIEIARAMG